MSLSQCLDDAPSREVAITPQLLRVLGPQWEVRFGAQLLPSGNYRLTTKPSALTDSIGASTASANSRTSGGATTAGTATTIFVGAAGVGTITGADTDISADTKSASENSKVGALTVSLWSIIVFLSTINELARCVTVLRHLGSRDPQ
ncbi:hypothetical protein EON64_00900 [archaeon]|nr:MAG: hypothetical protein EON64_00900 [archaeon]